ncbi:LOW QUALITY PROTEIN: hypothetical protein Dda_5159 [Drechslerella dactyloides]|uniref:proline--tRNA ligase n=1 Tax=Drechslerella dactyloides TaxID=74499 RepID=A0AAD6NIL1_DREDA|nr:LOW QUALITY PROTEIN: hypothetical protein Dda_5159 [Drechslerella dactyloides]
MCALLHLSDRLRPADPAGGDEVQRQAVAQDALDEHAQRLDVHPCGDQLAFLGLLFRRLCLRLLLDVGVRGVGDVAGHVAQLAGLVGEFGGVLFEDDDAEEGEFRVFGDLEDGARDDHGADGLVGCQELLLARLGHGQQGGGQVLGGEEVGGLEDGCERAGGQVALLAALEGLQVGFDGLVGGVFGLDFVVDGVDFVLEDVDDVGDGPTRASLPSKMCLSTSPALIIAASAAESSFASSSAWMTRVSSVPILKSGTLKGSNVVSDEDLWELMAAKASSLSLDLTIDVGRESSRNPSCGCAGPAVAGCGGVGARRGVGGSWRSAGYRFETIEAYGGTLSERSGTRLDRTDWRTDGQTNGLTNVVGCGDDDAVRAWKLTRDGLHPLLDPVRPRKALDGMSQCSHMACPACQSNVALRLRLDSQTDGRTRVSNLWLPVSKAKPNPKTDPGDVHSLLLKAGYLRNAYPGVFHMLPLGLRVQDKLERLIDRNMRAIGASKAALPSISAHSLWQRTGRVDKMGKELFQFRDRHGTQYLLGPTHEEEITTLVSSTVTSYKQLPLRVYQITRKYRDERRPRAGLLRGREFIMKDLYTFDASYDAALATYDSVVAAYRSIFDELAIPYLLAEADSGNMGGNLSHEYHLPCNTGEDTVLTCNVKKEDGSVCGFSANVECVENLPVQPGRWLKRDTKVWYAVSKDRKVLVKAYYPSHVKLASESAGEGEWFKREIDPRAIQRVVGDEGGGIEAGMEEASALNAWEENFTPWTDTLDEKTGQAKDGESYSRLIRIYDGHLLDGDGGAKFSTFSEHEADFGAESQSVIRQFFSDKKIPTVVKTSIASREGEGEQPIFLCKPITGDPCLRCPNGSLEATTTTELGHTFYLGTRYSDPLKATVGAVDDTGAQSQVSMQMGCFGIGVTRLIAAIAEAMRDEKGLCWPRVVAPYSVVVVYTGKKEGGESMRDSAEEVYDLIAQADNRRLEDDIVLDDREESVARKMTEADLVGYSVVVVLGARFEKEGVIEVQERATGRKHLVSREELSGKLQEILFL